ncbi:MAG: 6-pyruvoyl-tetrahydropterin synthase-related protein [Candidatus Levybacteria bacterium]|nr:6-pyruvoyl-tetrahydropterin synthase-related protein [Candidatus Levybacteria bacterium]MSU26097.1 hypothetical protein [Candidatus Levybacteria bacterium]
MSMVKKNIYWILILLITLLSVKSLFHYGLIPTHDGEYHIIRFYEFDKVLRSGILYPRWAPDLNNGYGIPLFNYVYPLPNYAASLIHVFGFSFIDSFKLSLIIASLFGSIFSYLWLRRFFGNLPALIGSIFFIYSPYRFVDIYVRGSIGEIWAMSLFLGVLWGTTEYIYIRKMKYFIISSILLAFTIFAHNILGFMYFVFYITYLLFMFINKKEHGEKKMFIIPILSLCISAIFWIPALFETGYVRGLQVFDVNNNFPELFQLIFPSWGTGFSTTDLNNQMSYQVGVANIFIVFCSIFLIRIKNEHKKLMLFFLGSFFFVIYLILSYSAWIWQHVPLIAYFQFSWRLLSLIVVFTAFISAYVANAFSGRIIRLTLLLLPIVFALQYTTPAYYLERPDSYYTTRPNFIDGTNSPGNVFNTKWMNGLLVKNNDHVIGGENVEYQLLQKSASEAKFLVKTEKKQTILVGIAYFPGWKIFVDEKEVQTTYNKDGIIALSLEEGNHVVRVVFENTNIRIIATTISLISLIGIFILVFRKRFKI